MKPLLPAMAAGLVLLSLFPACRSTFFKSKTKRSSVKLATAPERVANFNEIAVQYNDKLADLFNKLSPEERILTYYLFRASLPGNRITADQNHRHGNEIISMFKMLSDKKDALLGSKTFEAQAGVAPDAFVHDAQTFLVYLWTNHGQYFQREQADEKRTPARIGLKALTPQSLTAALTATGVAQAQEIVAELEATIFDRTFEPSGTVPNNIEASAANIYSPDFTTQDYLTLPTEERNKLNAYFFIDEADGKRTPRSIPYSAQGKYGQELSVSAYWLQKAYEHAQKHTQYFDKHLIVSLKHLINFVATGDEEHFKKHSIEWLKTSSRIDYNFGFIETYQDPKSQRGSFQAEVTIKSVDIKKLTQMLPDIEKTLPLPSSFMRDTLGTVPNASINTKVFGYGGLGPMVITAAYCLPNYEEIRSAHGSKQIIYPSSKSLAMRMNPDLARRLFNPKSQAAWLSANDPEDLLANDIWDTQVILHETLGHGSGKLAQHTFQDGEKMTIGGVTHKVGDTIDVTCKNLNEFLAGYENALEELRAEIIALYVSTHHLDQLMSCGLMTRWANKMTRDEMIVHMILGMAGTALRRYLQQSEDAKEIAGAHAQANCTIMYYMIDHGGLKLVEEEVEVSGKKHKVFGLEVVSTPRAQEIIKELMVEVQRIKSTGDGVAVKKLVDTYGKQMRHPEIMKALQANRKTIVGDVKCSAHIFPQLTPVVKDGDVVDVNATWPATIFDQYDHYEKIELSTKI